MINLSVNVNKVATLRNSRGGTRPSVPWAVRTCLAAGTQGITVHPRADRRHITPEDVKEIALILREHPTIEYNIEGDPRPDWVELVLATRPRQATLVPVRPGEVTSDHGWRFPEDARELQEPVRRLRAAGIRVSLFVEVGAARLELARELGADRIEIYTAPYAEASARGEAPAREAYAALEATAREARRIGLGINAGHDLDLENLPRLRALPGLMEVSIGHALMADALEMGLAAAVRAYLRVLADASA